MKHESFKLRDGVELPLIDLKGKPYMQVAHRLVWLNEIHPNFTIERKFDILTDTMAICSATVKLFEKLEDGTLRLLKEATATKAETIKGFADFIEKSETGAIGRALAMLGMGTQHVTQDFDEEDRLADAPVVPARKVVQPKVEEKQPEVVAPKLETPKSDVSFRRSQQPKSNGGF